MAWDSRRPVPWTRLMREWVVYALVMTAVFVLFFRDSGLVGALAGLLVSGPLYLALGAVLAKFGYQRSTITQLRAQRRGRDTGGSGDASGDATVATASRARPAPTRRTSTGPSNRPKRRR